MSHLSHLCLMCPSHLLWRHLTYATWHAFFPKHTSHVNMYLNWIHLTGGGALIFHDRATILATIMFMPFMFDNSLNNVDSHVTSWLVTAVIFLVQVRQFPKYWFDCIDTAHSSNKNGLWFNYSTFHVMS